MHLSSSLVADRLSTVRLINASSPGQCSPPAGLELWTAAMYTQVWAQFTHRAARYLKQLGARGAEREPAKHFTVTWRAVIKSSTKGFKSGSGQTVKCARANYGLTYGIMQQQCVCVCVVTEYNTSRPLLG